MAPRVEIGRQPFHPLPRFAARHERQAWMKNPSEFASDEALTFSLFSTDRAYETVTIAVMVLLLVTLWAF